VVSLTGLWLAARARRHLAERNSPQPVQDLAFGAVLVAAFAALFLLPGNSDPVDPPATLLWNFRLMSAAI